MELKLSDVIENNEKFRFDPEYFKKEYLKNINILKDFGYKIIDSIAFVTDGIHESIDFDSNSCINLISAKSPKENIFNLSSNHFISKNQHIANPRTELKENDVIISTVGTIGNCAVVDKTILPANSDRHVGIVRLNGEIKPHVLSTFLLSKYGRFQTFRESTGNVQLNLFIYKIKTLKIPNFSGLFQSKIETLVKSAHQKLEESKNLYKKAEEVLLEELNLLNFKTSQEKVAIKSFSDSFGSSGRLDSEYYQVKYEEILEKIKNVNFDYLEKIVDIKKSIEPGSKVYQNTGIPFVRISNLTKNGISNPDIHLPKSLFREKELEKLQPKKDTILLSKDGTIGIAYNVKSETNMVTSGAILHLTIKKEGILPEYLTLVLNSLLVKMQSERDAGGSIIKHWKPSEIAKILIPIIDISIQSQIENQINESFKLKEESEQLLEIAKRAIEIAIEVNEEKAEKHIRGNTNG